MRHTHDHILVAFIAFILLGIFALFTFKVSFMRPVANAIGNFSVTDVFYSIERKWLKPNEINEDIVLVDLTELTSRGDIARALSEIYEAEPIAIGVDLQFEFRNDSLNDAKLATTADSISDLTVFACKLLDYSEEQKCFQNVSNSFFVNSSIKTGYANLLDNMENKTIRTLSTRQCLNNDTILSIPAKIFQDLIGEDLPSNNEMFIDYSTNFISIPYADLKENKDVLKERIVLVGLMEEEADMHPSSIGKIPGLAIQGYSLATLLSHKSPHVFKETLPIIIAFILSFFIDITLCYIGKFVKSRSKSLSVFLSESRILLWLNSFLWLSFITLGSFMLFHYYNTYVETVLPLAVAGLTPLSHRLYYATKHSLFANKS